MSDYLPQRYRVRVAINHRELLSQPNIESFLIGKLREARIPIDAIHGLLSGTLNRSVPIGIPNLIEYTWEGFESDLLPEVLPEVVLPDWKLNRCFNCENCQIVATI